MALSFIYHGRLVIVLDEENVERMQAHDPFEFDSRKVPFPVTLKVPPQIVIAFARKDEQERIRAMQSEPDLLMEYLARGWKVTDTDGQRGERYKPL